MQRWRICPACELFTGMGPGLCGGDWQNSCERTHLWRGTLRNWRNEVAKPSRSSNSDRRNFARLFRFFRDDELRLFRFVLFGAFCVGHVGKLIGVGSGFAHGGVRGVTKWIEHVTYETMGRVTEVLLGAIRFSVPVIKRALLGIVLSWILSLRSHWAVFVCLGCAREECVRCKSTSTKVRSLIYTSNENGGSGIICGEGEAAGGHCSRDRRIRAAEEERAKFHAGCARFMRKSRLRSVCIR